MANTLGGVFRPSDDMNLTGTVTVSGSLVSTGTTTLTSPTLSSPTLTTPTLTTPTLTAPSGTASTGLLITKSGVITELTGTATYTITIPVPAGAWVQDITVTNQALWTAGTSATGTVGDTADPDGFFTGIDMKATDLVVGEVLSVKDSTLWGGKEGAYLVAATGRRGPTSTNFGLYYAAGSNIVFAVAKTGTGTAGRTHVSVTYSVGEVIAQTVA